MEYLIPACTGKRIDVRKGQIITVVDAEGGQVADFFAVSADNQEEFLSTAVTIDCNESLRVGKGSIIFTNLYRPMFEIVLDDVGCHDLLFPSCRPEMYDFFYCNGKGHPNCFDNINGALGEKRPIINPINLFMNTHVEPDGKVIIEPPVSKAGDRIILKAIMDATIGIAACSVSESATNSGKCTAIAVEVDAPLFRQALPSEVELIFNLVKSRVQWMDETGIRQWNVTGYLEAYPISYYEERQSDGSLYVLAGDETIFGTVVLLEEDERWEDKASDLALYVHNLATMPGEKGAGRRLLAEAERMARFKGKRYIRLDCAKDNQFLNSYYDSLGYQLAGTFEEGLYKGNRREKGL